MKEYFSVILYSFIFRFIINCIKALIRITIMEMTRVGRSGCNDPDESSGYRDINDAVVILRRKSFFK